MPAPSCHFRLLLSLFLLLCLPVQAGEKVRLAPDLTVGHGFLLQLTKSRETDIPERSHRQGRHESKIRVRVKAVSPSGYTLEWRYLDVGFAVPGVSQAGDTPTLRKLHDLSRGTRYLMRFAADGSFLELGNYAEVKPRLARLFDLLGELEPKLKGPALEMMHKLLASRQTTEQLLVRDVLLYFNPMLWGEAELESSQPYASELANPFGGDPLRAVGSLHIGDAGGGRVKVVLEQRIDPDAVPAVLSGLMRRVGQPLAEAELENLRRELSGFDIQDRAEYLLPSGKGWPTQVTHSRAVVTAKGREVTRIEVRRLAP